MPNGLSAVECDLTSMLNRLKKEVGSGGKLVVGTGAVKVDSLGTQVIVLESQLPTGSNVQLVERLFIDPTKKLPVQWDLFNKGQFASRTSFNSFQSKENWDISQFKL